MAYFIKNAQNERISLNQLDVEVCEFWGKDVDSKQYAYPDIKPEKFNSIKEEVDFIRRVTNWNDKIEFGLLNLKVEQYSEVSWDVIIDNLIKFFTEEEKSNPEFEKFVKNDPDMHFIGGFWKLFEHWKEKGYKLYTLN